VPRSRGFGQEKMPHRLIQLRLQTLAAPVDVRRICYRRGAGRQEIIFRLDRPIVPECPSTPAPTVQPTGVSEAAKLNGVTMILVYARHPELRGTLQQRRGQPV